MFCTQESTKSQKDPKRDKTDQIEKMTQLKPCHTAIDPHGRVQFNGSNMA
ncbi:hypothetical protein F383_29038 [Gossypium arboreum]|uniref:Uncharacterized protein n=1 Tax=Gossypium arboreum TaxID=29729 RepID=A0A0B0P9M3_GOSAR|nr:hypothetical protein F383_29038 [Gossypium arboreum]